VDASLQSGHAVQDALYPLACANTVLQSRAEAGRIATTPRGDPRRRASSTPAGRRADRPVFAAHGGVAHIGRTSGVHIRCAHQVLTDPEIIV